MANAPTSSRYRAICELLPHLTEAEQLALIVELVQGGPAAGLRSNAFIDALWPVDQALSAAFADLDAAAVQELAA